ncbi:cholesteryl ester transfer protein L homeolog precursor [Xenopus laevis]|uniref:Cholesteryl ester transfer protein n=2 Tax=Xenopus laevis TaxID=8355 RepID=Q5PPV0_XENLA|nr:cholesteryl ester transfer protein L homeolog precursor [Xenopus laevis]AAH87487.1 LOC496072 protein [Xenopus laevis]OCT84371.1 hypothetical protein XELAEV_18022524mg [Xenopus laevis]
MWPMIFFCACFLSISSACDFDPSSPLETGIVCRVTKPAALVLNEQTAQVIQAAFRHASYPDINGEKAIRFFGQVTYGLTNIQISNLTIGSSEVELREDDAVYIMIKNVSASFSGTLSYGYGAWFMKVGQTIDFEIDSSTDLQINTKLTCGNNRVAADTSDCYLTFHKLVLHLYGDKQPGWLKQLFTDFISFTLKLVLKRQICKEINYVANLLADFIQDKAEDFLRDGDIGVDISVTSFPVIKAGYMESRHKGAVLYRKPSDIFNSSLYTPSLLSENRMLYFWFSEHVLNSMAQASFFDGRLELKLTGSELKDILKDDDTESHEANQKIFHGLSLSNSVTKIWSLTPPEIRITPEGTIVTSSVAVQLNSTLSTESQVVGLYFETDVTATVKASYADKKLILNLSDSIVHIKTCTSSLQTSAKEKEIRQFLHKTISLYGIAAVMKRMEPALTSLMNSKGLNLFDIINPEIIHHKGYLIVQLDFGFPHHLLVDFLKKAL